MTPATAERIKATKKLTLTDAADQWEKADVKAEKLKRELKRLEGLKDQAAPVLLAHFERANSTTYKGRIALVQGAPRTILDQTKVKALLGDRLPKYEKTVVPQPSLKRVQK